MGIQQQIKTKLRKGDEVIVLAGEDRGRRGKILRVNKKSGRVVVEGVNKAKRHERPTQKNPQGGIVEKEMPIHLSNVMFWDPTEEKPTRVGYKTAEDGSRVRISKVSGETIED